MKRKEITRIAPKSGCIQARQGTEIWNFGGLSPLEEFYVQWMFFSLFSGLLCNVGRKSPQHAEKIARFPGGEKTVESWHVSGCHGFFFFGPDKDTRQNHFAMRNAQANRQEKS